MDSRQRPLRLSASCNYNHVDRKACALLAVKVAPDGEVLGNVVLLIERVKEAARLDAVVALRSPFLILTQLSTQNQHSATVIFHCLQCAQGDRLINLSCAPAIARNREPPDLTCCIVD